MSQEEEEQGLDIHAIVDIAKYVLRAPKRRPARFFALLAISVALAAAIFALYPRTYSTEVKILAQRNLVLPALGNPNRTVPREADNPTKNVGDTILKHDNLVLLIKQVNLMDRWEATRPPLLRLKDRIQNKLSPGQTEEDRLRSIEGVLEKRLTVTSDDQNNTITIVAEWSDARMAFDIAQAVEKNFVDARYDAEISVIDDAIDILQQHAKEEKTRFDQARVEFESIDPKTGAKTTTATPAPRPVAQERAPHVDSAATQKEEGPVDATLLKALEDKRASIQQIETQRSARVAELDKQLSDALIQYRPEHPTVVGLKQKLAAAQADSPDLVRLQTEERALIDKVAQSAPPVARAIAAASSSRASARTIAALTGAPSSPLVIEEDPAVTVARMKLQQSAQKYADLETRIDGAKIELDIAKTAHKYRYGIIRPAEVSKHAHKPSPVGLAGGLLVLILAISFGGVVLDERKRGVVVERWQVERKLKLPILGELEA
ncbi:MAG TPA: hypothetical protein VGH28_12085 [Polyangiaceae bacterium]|jgi:capsular polysaccharide biosynthesis protein